MEGDFSPEIPRILPLERGSAGKILTSASKGRLQDAENPVQWRLGGRGRAEWTVTVAIGTGFLGENQAPVKGMTSLFMVERDPGSFTWPAAARNP